VLGNNRRQSQQSRVELGLYFKNQFQWANNLLQTRSVTGRGVAAAVANSSAITNR
jgi:hypothetical protein